MFRGHYIHTLDDKFRVIVPQKFRLELGMNFVITRGVDPCLWIFREDEFKEIEARLTRMEIASKENLRLQRYFSGFAFEVTTDAQGRVAIPPALRELVGIDKEVVIVGTINRVEIWSKQNWEEYSATMTDEVITESTREVGIA
ncbi:MAG: division/cell wall cluster transcriptional repressor MraZ [Armatimonadetes bacterium]|nr:division/cell wall cluster transcriptional repressor MraZ [Armatimonadota bacterium]